MGGAGFFVAFFIILALISFGGFEALPEREAGERTGTERSVRERNTTPRSAEPERLSNREIEQRIADIYDDLDDLTEELREAKLREPISPHADRVTLRASRARTQDPEDEYLTITASSRNEVPINISDWYLESYVTGERVGIPQGARVPVAQHRSQNRLTDIFLLPGERATLQTTESPVDFSFHENVCTGYFAEQHDFSPSLGRRCPDAEDEMVDFTRISVEDDSCYDFVERIGRCEIVPDDEIFEADLSRACELFVIDELTYQGCLANHKNDPFFDDVGIWRIYFDRNRAQWRSEREIIRLMDEERRVVDVVEY